MYPQYWKQFASLESSLFLRLRHQDHREQLLSHYKSWPSYHPGGPTAKEAARALVGELIKRKDARMTAFAEKMGTTKSTISRLESAGKHAPSLNTLRRYAKAVGCELHVKLVPQKVA